MYTHLQVYNRLLAYYELNKYLIMSQYFPEFIFILKSVLTTC